MLPELKITPSDALSVPCAWQSYLVFEKAALPEKVTSDVNVQPTPLAQSLATVRVALSCTKWNVVAQSLPLLLKQGPVTVNGLTRD